MPRPSSSAAPSGSLCHRHRYTGSRAVPIRKYGRSMPLGTRRGNWTTSMSGAPVTAIACAGSPTVAGPAGGMASGIPAVPTSSFGSMVSTMRARHCAHSGAGLREGSDQTTRSTSSCPLCSACTQTPSTEGLNQRGFTMIWPTSGIHAGSIAAQAESSGAAGSVSTRFASMTSRTRGASPPRLFT